MGSKLNISIVEDDEFFASIAEKAILYSSDEHEFSVEKFTSGEEFLEILSSNPNIVILDLNLPGISGLEVLEKIKDYNNQIKVIVISEQKEVELVVKIYRAGASDYVVKSPDCFDELIRSFNKLTSIASIQANAKGSQNATLDRNKYLTILGNSKPIHDVLNMIQKIENNNIGVLLTGESGTGKELVAQTIHYNSNRNNKPFVPVNIPAIPQTLIESELFGHEKGAFTGASGKRLGKFEEAGEGTILLDEIGEMSIDMQVKLLRVLQENEITRVGGNKIIKIKARVITSTNRDLVLEVKKGRFRQDLYYRVSGFLIHLPPLKERGEDVLLIANNFIEKFCDENNLNSKNLSEDAMSELLSYDWPGNIRELKTVVERAALLTTSDEILSEHLVFAGAKFEPPES
ncbi:MAG: sigma-54-dependent Fis family transcriptional regulator [Bacteroidia bacterium]|nr:sigma-54-dependent Fis family transcriptional regulator [Bacteroidia bacterium]